MMLYLSLCVMALGYLSDAVISFSSPFLDDDGGEQCIDRMTWCDKLGRRLPLSRCYDRRHYSRCCATCDRLRLPLPSCEFGDKEAFCTSIGKEKPAADCYAHNKTCCQTCHLYDSGVPGCPFGDRVNWCSGIGDRYDVLSCYDHEIHCCDTCRQFRTMIPGCPYGNRMAWCNGIGIVYPIEYCATSGHVCCQTCHRLRQQGYTFEVNHTTTTTEPGYEHPQENTTPVGSRSEHIQEKLDRLNEHGAAWPPIPSGEDTTSHSSLTSSTHLPTSPAPVTPPPHSSQSPAELPVVLTPTTLERSTTPASVDSKNSAHKPSDNQTTLWQEIGLPRKPSISANKSILVTNDSAKGEVFATSERGLIPDPKEYSTESDTQTGAFIHHHGNNGPLNSHQGLIATTESSDYSESTSPISSLFDSDGSDRTHIQGGIDPGGPEETQNRSSDTDGVTSGRLYEPDGIHVHENGSVVQGISNKRDKQNTSQSKGHVENTVNGVSSGAGRLQSAFPAQLTAVLFLCVMHTTRLTIITFTNIHLSHIFDVSS